MDFDYLSDFRSMNPEFAENMSNYMFVEWFDKMRHEPVIEELDGAHFSVRQETYLRMIKMWKNSQLSESAMSRLSPAEQESALNIRRMVDEDMTDYAFATDLAKRAAVSKSQRDALFRENAKLKAQSNKAAAAIEKAHTEGVELQQIRRADAAGAFSIGDDYDLTDDELEKPETLSDLEDTDPDPIGEGDYEGDYEGDFDGDSYDGDYDDGEVETVIESGPPKPLPGGDVEMQVLKPGRAPAPGTARYILDQLDAAIDQKPMPTYELPAPEPVPDAGQTWESRRVIEPLEPAAEVDPFAAEPGATVPKLPPPPGDSKIRPGEMDFGKTPDPAGANPNPEDAEDWFDPATKRSVFKRLFGGKSRSDVPAELRDFYDELNTPYAPKDTSGGITNWFKRQLGINKKLPGLESAEQGATRLNELGKPLGGDAFGDTGPIRGAGKITPLDPDALEHKYDGDPDGEDLEEMFDPEGRPLEPELVRELQAARAAEPLPEEAAMANLREALTEFSESNSFRDVSTIEPNEGLGISSTGELWIKPGAFKSWLTRLGTGAVLGQLVIGPVLSALDGLVPGVGTMVGTGLNVFGMLTTGDPTGLIIQAGMAVYRMYQEQERKRKENLSPDADRGKKLGYVRMGNKWVPAVFSSRAQDVGIGAHDDTVIAQTGDDIVFRYVGNLHGGGGEFQPWVRNKDGSAVQEKMLRMTDDEYEDEIVKTGKGAAWERKWHVHEARDADDPDAKYARYGSKDLVENFDMLRNWYMLDPEDVTAIAEGKMPFEAYDETYYGTGADDPGLANPYETQLNDWRLVMEAMATPSDRYVDPELVKQLTEWDLSGELRAAVNDGRYTYKPGEYQKERINPLMGSSQGADKWGYNDPDYGFAGLDAMGYYDKMTSERNFYRGSVSGTKIMPENDWLLNTLFTNQIKLLQRSQRSAAEEMGFDKTYGHDPYREYHKDFFKSPTFNIPDQTEEYQPIWASLYLDTTKSMQTATDAAMLSTQLETIAGYDDRSPAQQDYLRQKAITRYWIGQIGSRGGSEELVQKMYGFKMNAFDPLKAQLSNPAFDFKRIMDDGHDKLDDSPWVNSYYYSRKSLTDSVGWVMPWQNKDEGILPEDVMGMPIAGGWDNLLERMDDEAREHTSEWIAEHGRFNPNLLIDKHEVEIGDHDIMDSYDWVDPDPKPEEPEEPEEPDDEVDYGKLVADIVAGLKSADPEGWFDSDGFWNDGEGPPVKVADLVKPPVVKPPVVKPPVVKPPVVTPPVVTPPVVPPPVVPPPVVPPPPPVVAPTVHHHTVPVGPEGGVAATGVASGRAHIPSFKPSFGTIATTTQSTLLPTHHDLGYIHRMEHHDAVKVV